MAGSVGNDEFSFRSGKITISHVYSNSLFAFRLQTIYQQRQINVPSSGSRLNAIGLNGCKLVFIDHLGVMKQATDQCALAIIHATTGQQAQQFLAFVLSQVGIDVGAN